MPAVPGRSLGLGRIPRYFGGRKRSDGKGSTGNTIGHSGPVTADQADDREAGHVVAKSLRCKPWEVTDFMTSSGISGQTTGDCWSAGLLTAGPAPKSPLTSRCHVM